MEFKKMKERMIRNFEENFDGRALFEVELDKDYLWDVYLNSFPAGTNEIYRKRREYDCSCCRHFLKTMGSVVRIDQHNDIHTIFEFDTGSEVFQPVMDALDKCVKTHAIVYPFVTSEYTVGTDKNHELCADGSVNTYEHFFLHVPNECIKKKDELGTIRGHHQTRATVFKRSLDEISLDAVNTVLELIESKSLYKGEEWMNAIRWFKTYKIDYDSIPDNKKCNWTWLWSAVAGDVVCKIRNHSIGVLLTDISNGMELEEAVRRYERIVAPTNYKRPKAVFTKKMLEDAKKTVSELGYMDSLGRRFATMDDITVNNILFSNRDVTKKTSGNVFDDMMADVNIDAKKFSKVEEVNVDKFVNDILPTAKELEVLLENRHSRNMVSLIAPQNKDAKSMFKWDNGFSWSYAGNITDSDIRENVKMAGGNVEGALRFSIQWNDGDTPNDNDLDAHCFEKSFGMRKDHIYFGHKRSNHTRGFLDVDIIHPSEDIKGPAVENIAWAKKSDMYAGTYRFVVHEYSYRGGNDGFRAEIEFDGNIYSYNYDGRFPNDGCVEVATVALDKNGNFSIEHHLKSNQSSRDIWGLKSNTFVPVSTVMYSPNYWDDQRGVGHRHYFFMLKDCKNPNTPNGFYNEFLKHELEPHKRVFEALGNKMAVEESDNQLSGIGFSATKRNDLIVRVRNDNMRVMRVKF